MPEDFILRPIPPSGILLTQHKEDFRVYKKVSRCSCSVHKTFGRGFFPAEDTALQKKSRGHDWDFLIFSLLFQCLLCNANFLSWNDESAGVEGQDNALDCHVIC